MQECAGLQDCRTEGTTVDLATQGKSRDHSSDCTVLYCMYGYLLLYGRARTCWGPSSDSNRPCVCPSVGGEEQDARMRSMVSLQTTAQIYYSRKMKRDR